MDRIGDQFGTQLIFLIEGDVYLYTLKKHRFLACTAGLMFVWERMRQGDQDAL